MRDLRVEQILTRGGYKFDPNKPILISEIDMQTSRDNPARLFRNLDQDRAINYGLLMESGVDFPAILLLNALPGSGPYKWVVVGGMHRLEAALLAHKTKIDAYCVYEPDAYRRKALAYHDNAKEGKGLDLAEQVAIIIEMHQSDGIPLSQLSKEWGHQLKSLRQALNDRKATRRGLEAGYDFSKYAVPNNVRRALNQIALEATYRLAIDVVCHHKLSSAETEAMVDDIKKARDEVTAAEVVKHHKQLALKREEGRRVTVAKIPRSPSTKLLSSAKSFVKHLEKGVEPLYLSAIDDIPYARNIIGQVMQVAREIKTELDRIETTRQAAAKVVPLQRA